MTFVSREDQVHPCHMSPSRHDVNVLLKTLYDEDATIFPANLFLTQIFLAVISLPFSMCLQTRLFPSLYLSSIICLFSSHTSANYTMLICSVGSSKTSVIGVRVYIHIYVCAFIFILMIISISGVGEHRVIRTAMSLKVLPTEKSCWTLACERSISPLPIYAPKLLVCSWVSPKHWSIFGPEISHVQITEKTCNIRCRWQIWEAIRKGS